MKIIIEENEGKNLHLSLPSALLLNRFTACLVPGIMKKNGTEMTRDQAQLFIQELNNYRCNHPEWVFLDMEEADGSHITVKL